MQKSNHFWHLLFWTQVIVGFAGCAQVGQLQGGKKDETPPGIDSTKSSKSYQTKVEKANFQLTYDEWIKLDDPINKMNVSPPVRYRPTVTLSGRTVNFAFDKREILRKEATYHINFGESIKDLNEGNIAKENDFVFSTGPVIDTMSQSFLVLDALSGEPVEKVNVLIHENLSDTAVLKDLPFYMGTTNKAGACTIQNMRAGTYHFFALSDKNQNLKFDLPTESFAMLDTAINFEKSGQQPIILKLSLERPRTKITSKEFVHDGLVKIVYNQPPLTQSLRSIPQTGTFVDYQQDTTFVYYPPAESDLQIIVQADQLNDTITLRKLIKRNLVLPKLGYKTNPVSFAQTIIPNKPIEVLFNFPLTSFNQDSIALYADTTKKTRISPKVTIDSAHRNTLRLNHPYEDKKTYLLYFKKNSVSDHYGRSIDSTFEQKYVAADSKELAALTIQIDSLNPIYNYIVTLQTTEKVELVRQEVIGKKQFLQTYDGLNIEDYFVKIVEDRNNNHQWDPVNYEAKQLPEYIYMQKAEGLRPNFTVEKIIEFSTKNITETNLNKRQSIQK